MPGILVYRVGQLGDAVVAIPAIHAIRARHPDAGMALLTDRHPAQPDWVSSWDVLGALGVFAKVVFYEPAGSLYVRLTSGWRLARTLRRMRFDIVYNLAPARNAWQRFRDRFFFMYMVGATHYRTPQPLTRRFPRNAAGGLAPVRPEWERLLRVAGDTPDPAAGLAISEDARLRAESIFRAAGGSPGQPIVAIGPGSKMQSKRWPAARFAAVIESLRARFPEYAFVVFGGKEDVQIGEELVARFAPCCVNLAGRLSISQSAALLERCSLYVGNDTGTMHLAAAVRCPCVAIFSARDRPGLWAPFGAGHRIFRVDPPCAGCMLEVCETQALVCLTSIPASEIVAAAAQMLSSPASAWLPNG